MKPSWLNKKIDIKVYDNMKRILRGYGVETVCEQAMCPNAGECFSRKQATFLILGKQCTRMCSFCNIDKGKPSSPDPDEPGRVAEAVAGLSLKHVVVTSVTRDDLPDGGAEVFANTVHCIRRKSPDVTIELLIPDFKLSPDSLDIVIKSSPKIIAHNIETVPSLYKRVRPGADYLWSLDVLRIIKETDPLIRTKSGIMLGMGEREEEVLSVMNEVRSKECDFFSIGQYLAPSKRHYPVKEYIDPEKFDYFKRMGMDMGFTHIESAPYVRSSYASGEYLND